MTNKTSIRNIFQSSASPASSRHGARWPAEIATCLMRRSNGSELNGAGSSTSGTCSCSGPGSDGYSSADPDACRSARWRRNMSLCTRARGRCPTRQLSRSGRSPGKKCTSSCVLMGRKKEPGYPSSGEFSIFDFSLQFLIRCPSPILSRWRWWCWRCVCAHDRAAHRASWLTASRGDMQRMGWEQL
jgi:hypothetical protein